MEKKEYHVIGVMSGTSLDGIDLAQVRFRLGKEWQFEILNAQTIDYSENWKSKLKGLSNHDYNTLQSIDKSYTLYLGEVINGFIKRNKIKEIDAVCSHGHTARHQPDSGVTYQIGNRAELATLISQTLVCDFRVQDVAFGGQGAPLVPIGDKLLFSKFDYCINLGGFANISLEKDNTRIAYDICPVNIVLNHYANLLGLDYDAGGGIARSGNIDMGLLTKLNALDYYKAPYPKSLGVEWVDLCVLPLIDAFKLEIKTILRTFVEHVAHQIVAELDQVKARHKSSVLVTGGGAYNTFLIERIKDLTKHDVLIPSNKVVEFKEALIFGFLGVLKLQGKNNCLKSVTGAIKDHSSGQVFLR
ncbi:anhydro-N-acetylmuramic acid kinase [Cognatitamlana onchidii]|uniref:anhydro-N-acetylmuramic acid kinase n=1 Tax=Cognatitamlana onchidii TaxID=2562860 RepID=UPI0010A608E5|nr:anhydro-N-acetylmuramic acid kinase [Algibacter onchidii]